MRMLVAGRQGSALLLGVTPELTDIASKTLAVDHSDGMLRTVWPGDRPTRCAVKGSWLNLPCSAAAFSTVLGDGSFNCLEYPLGYQSLFDELARAMSPGGRIAVRVFTLPDRPESPQTVRMRTMAGCVGSVHALKWLLAYAICVQRSTPNVSVQTIADEFNRHFPNRADLQRATGWRAEEIASIDAYEGMADVYSFPSIGEMLAVVPPSFERPKIVHVGCYELSDRCPLFVVDAKS